MGDILLSGSGSSSGGGGDGAILDGVSSSIKATVKDYANSNPLTTILVDINGDPASIGGGTQYAEDTPATAGEIITMAGVVRQDTPATLVSNDGDRTELTVDNKNRLWINGSDVTQPVSNAGLTNIDVALSTRLKPADTLTKVATVDTITNVVHIDDNGGSITVDGTITTSPPANASTNVAQFGGNAVVTGTGASGVGIPRVTVSSDSAITANAGTNLNTSLLALESGGNLATLAGIVTATRAAVNPISGQVGVQGASGVVTALTQRVVLATDVALPTGSNAIGKLAANDGVDIGDVTINNAAGASAVNIQDGGNSITVDGAVSIVVPTTSVTTRINPAWRQDVQFLAANASRKEGLIVNRTNASFFLKEGSGASEISFTEIVPPRGRYIFDGTTAIDGWWNDLPTDGFVFATERT